MKTVQLESQLEESNQSAKAAYLLSNTVQVFKNKIKNILAQ